jgi:hypothetical protein
MRQTKVDHVLNGLADLVVKHERTITTQAKIIEAYEHSLRLIRGSKDLYCSTTAQTVLDQAKEIETK